jgi:hypothetical protein
MSRLGPSDWPIRIGGLLLEADTAATIYYTQAVNVSRRHLIPVELILVTDIPVEIRRTFGLPHEEPDDLEKTARQIAAEFVAAHRSANG